MDREEKLSNQKEQDVKVCESNTVQGALGLDRRDRVELNASISMVEWTLVWCKATLKRD